MESFLDLGQKINSILVATMEGGAEARSVWRVAVERRWGEDCVNWVECAPWQSCEEAIDADGDLPEGVPADEFLPILTEG